MAIIVKEIETSINEDLKTAIDRARRLLGVSAQEVRNGWIVKTSLDARKRNNIRFVHSVSLELEDESAVVKRLAGNKRISQRTEQPLELVRSSRPLDHRPVIAGFGPAGMFAALLLAREGYRPLILERGASIDERAIKVERFWKDKILDSETNVQFGEGGAGAFSDGKLTTRIGDPKCSWVLKQLVQFGAPPEILYQAKPHIGTDRLRNVVRTLREEIVRLGGEIRFETPMDDLRMENAQLHAIKAKGEEIPAQALILATGHSARETFSMLLQHKFSLVPKPFSVGVRIEHLQETIDRGLYGDLAGHPALPIGEYQLSYRQGERGVYSFCMCPGGVVVPASSQEGMVVTNGMSYHAREGKNANAALVVSVTPKDYGLHPLDGIEFQKQLERAAFMAGGSSYCAPAQDAESFLAGKKGYHPGRVEPSYQLGVCEADFSALFPAYVTKMLKDGFVHFGRKLPGFCADDVVLTGVETRTSSPVRILRGDDLQASGMRGVYPCAEGAGYAGGIMSAAVDGLRVAMRIIAEYAPVHS